MKILRNKTQVEEFEEEKNKALDESKTCPCCGLNGMLNIISYEEYATFWDEFLAAFDIVSKMHIKCICPKCGAIWISTPYRVFN